MQFIKTYKWLIPMLAFTAVLLAYRIVYTHTIGLCFIPWNLLLAGLPLIFSYMLNKITDLKIAWGMFGLWLLFFPNAIYIVTDMFHLKEGLHVPQWFDLLILFSAALSGLIMGMVSLNQVEKFLVKKLNRKYVPFIVFSLFLLCGYGVYLGRYERWNSWDIFTEPFSLFLNIGHDVRHPFQNQQSWMLSLLFAAWLYTLYVFSKKVRIAN